MERNYRLAPRPTDGMTWRSSLMPQCLAATVHPASSGLDQPVSNGQQRQLRLVDHSELLLDVVKVCADGRGGQFQIFRDSLHRRTAREANEDFELTLGKPL